MWSYILSNYSTTTTTFKMLHNFHGKAIIVICIPYIDRKFLNFPNDCAVRTKYALN